MNLFRNKKIVLFYLIFLFIFCSVSYGLANDRPLEIVYPKIPGAPELEYVTTGLPQYVTYIFRFVVIIVGFVILGVLIYNGVIYLISAGNPAKMTESRKGILSGIIGAVILLSAFLIFNTINPQLTILDITKIEPLAPMVIPGLYICNYKDDSIQGILTKYLQKDDTNKQLEAAKELKAIMDPKDGTFCMRANFSGNFDNFEIKQNKNTFFIIPREVYESGQPVPKYLSEYNMILHEKDNFGGRCQHLIEQQGILYPEGKAGDFIPIVGSFNQLNFTARSFTLFKQPPGEGEVTLYNCYNYNETGACPEGVEPKEITFAVGGTADEIQFVSADELEELKENTLSIKLHPKGNVFAIIYDKEGAQDHKKCEVIKNSIIDLTEHPIGRCEKVAGGCSIIIGWLVSLLPGEQCVPCIKSMYVVNGQTM